MSLVMVMVTVVAVAVQSDFPSDSLVVTFNAFLYQFYSFNTFCLIFSNRPSLFLHPIPLLPYPYLYSSLFISIHHLSLSSTLLFFRYDLEVLQSAQVMYLLRWNILLSHLNQSINCKTSQSEDSPILIHVI